MNSEYEENGYVVLQQLFGETELQILREVVDKFHQSWIQENALFYKERAVNSAYLTANKHLVDFDREVLFKFIASEKLMALVTSILGSDVAFMNTQLFFNPVDDAQKNYWHRDPQYHLSIDEQKEALQGPKVIHFRIPLFDEPGVELISGTHRRWDSDEELHVRLERNGRKNNDSLSAGVKIALNAGDVLVFSANMIHRGLYGMNRQSLDILFCDPAPELLKFVDDDCLPTSKIIEKLDNPCAFENTIAAKAKRDSSKPAIST